MSWGGAWAFMHYVEFFAKQGFAVYALDLRGHGKSGGTVEGATMQNYVEDVRTITDHFQLDNPLVVGHSMGGLIALMYASQYPIHGVVAIDASATQETQGTSEEVVYPASYTPMDAGMPSDPQMVMQALSDIEPSMLMKMKDMLGVESGVARSERKKGISVPKESLNGPAFFIGAQLGTSVPFGIGIEKARAQAEYYDAPVAEIADATHPGLLVGKHWEMAAQAILDWIHSL